jgi:hypothetical protein
MIPRLELTPEELAYAKSRYRPNMRDRGAAAIARELGVSRDGLLRHIDPEYRKKRNASAAKCMARKRVPIDRPSGRQSNDARYAEARAKVTLAPMPWVDC